jgi:hypothetical protein
MKGTGLVRPIPVRETMGGEWEMKVKLVLGALGLGLFLSSGSARV